jgi:hypothetical protein
MWSIDVCAAIEVLLPALHICISIEIRAIAFKADNASMLRISDTELDIDCHGRVGWLNDYALRQFTIKIANIGCGA